MSNNSKEPLTLSERIDLAALDLIKAYGDRALSHAHHRLRGIDLRIDTSLICPPPEVWKERTYWADVASAIANIPRALLEFRTADIVSGGGPEPADSAK